MTHPSCRRRRCCFPFSYYQPGAKLCIRAVDDSGGSSREQQEPCAAACIASGTLDQINSGPRDGRWQRALSAVPLTFNQSYEFLVT
eukprot:COSAG02_NODE_45682_length_355_cov_0.597656_1_plen_85_part_01